MRGDDAPTTAAGRDGDGLERALFGIVQRATPLQERLQRASAPLPDEAVPDVVQARLDTWCQAIADGDWGAFGKRLAWDGIDLALARAAVGTPPAAGVTRLPTWAETLREALAL